MKDGSLLKVLCEVLSEKKYAGKWNDKANMRPQQIDNINNALNFCYKDCGVELKLKTSAEDILDAKEGAILALVWAILLKFIKFGDEDGGPSMNAKEALLMWCQNKTATYKEVKIDNFGRSWHDGLALCAIIHKHRPRLIDWASLDKSNPAANIEKAQDAALRYFGLEKYITPQEFLKLDEASMVIYVSEYFYGIAEQRKLDLAARRLVKLINLTKENDKDRANYIETATALVVDINKTKVLLEDRTIDNTMAGAKKRIEDFYAYKASTKSAIISRQLQIEGIYNNLAMRLSHHKRPQFEPPQGLSLKGLQQEIVHLEECEAERKVALHAELNRQIRLVQLNDQHKSRFTKLTNWSAEKSQYLADTAALVVESVSAAQLQLRLHDAFVAEKATLKANVITSLKALGAELVAEKYEHSADVQKREADVDTAFAALDASSAALAPVLADHLSREEFKVAVRLLVKQHEDRDSKLVAWIADKEAYARRKETITSVYEATTQLSLLDQFNQDKQSALDTSVAQLKKLGEEILASKYATQYSKWEYEHPEKIQASHGNADAKFAELSDLSAEKKRVLDDDLARETFKDKLRMMDRNHTEKFDQLNSWAAEKEAYLHKVETVESVPEAQTQLALLSSYEKEAANVTEVNVAALKKAGQDLVDARYTGPYSSAQWEQPEQVHERHTAIDSKWGELAQLAAAKKATLDADLAREQEKERLRLQFAHDALDYVRWGKDQVESLNEATFGFTLEEVEAYTATVQKFEGEVRQAGQQKHAGAKALDQQMTGLGVKENVYTKLSLADLAHSDQQFEAALASHNERYQKELAHQRHIDQLCREFAAIADPFSKWINDTKDKIATASADLPTQLEFVNERLAQRASEDRTAAATAIQDQLDKEGVTNNRHTPLTGKDVAAAWEQYNVFLERKKKTLEDTIEQQKLRGLTAEQFAEIQSNFEQFDTDKNGSIDARELKAALYSLGEEKTQAQIKEIMAEFGKSDIIEYSGFREFMIRLLGDADTKDEVVSGFKLISRGEVGDFTRLSDVLAESYVEYIRETAPKSGDGFDFITWTDDVYSR
jgi:Ca2+-binding EF-hand superfamily protein